MGSCGEYSDRSDWNIVVVRSEQRAEEIVDKLKRLQLHNTEFQKRAYEEFETPYRKNNVLAAKSPERPLFDSVANGELRRLQKIIEVKAATLDDKQRYKELQKEWLVVCNAHSEKVREYYEMHSQYEEIFQLARKQWKSENYNLPQELLEVVKIGKNGYDNRYSYQEIELED